MRCNATEARHADYPGNRKVFVAISGVQKSLETYASLLSSDKSPWSVGEIADSIRDDAKRLKELAGRFDFEKEVFE